MKSYILFSYLYISLFKNMKYLKKSKSSEIWKFHIKLQYYAQIQLLKLVYYDADKIMSSDIFQGIYNQNISSWIVSLL